jgi:hypothetical protein
VFSGDRGGDRHFGARGDRGGPPRSLADGAAQVRRGRRQDIERAVLEALELDFLSPAALHRAAHLAMEFFEKQQTAETRTIPAWSAALAEINAREAADKEQFKTGKLPAAIFKTWLAELAKERDVLNRPTTLKPARISHSEFLQEYRSAVQQSRVGSKYSQTART